MSENCNHDCANCAEKCDDRNQSPDMYESPHEFSNIKKVIGVVSGKGGVGKSLVTSLMAVLMNRRGFNTAILDADMTGPSIPNIFNLKGHAVAGEFGLLPVKTKTGIEIMSINLLLGKTTDPVVWRGPIIASMVKQFWTEVVWRDVDFMFVDMPPGTGDVPLTVFQTIKVDGIIVVTSPQQLVSMIVAKAVNMAKLMNVPILGIVENMSYFKCPDTGKEHSVFGESRLEEVAKENSLNALARIPIDPKLSAASDAGMIELFDGGWLDGVADILEEMI
ncbi:MAG: Mrp/NBP35 family ATP-binding protein [Ruminococcaceae bacterium]|nr:Mrp/NBP35 family ATP-binding protein [Oscillospiraceae bacterium]